MDTYHRECAINCVGAKTLNQYKRQLEACGGDVDLLFCTDTEDDDFYRKVIEPGRVYETGYPRCICWKNDGIDYSCECSRQALLYLYSKLLPGKEITVETVQTVRLGAESCKFRIIIN